ncbi:unnamed protein product [Chondrus crispus]|uniref:Uncharacterized protein n=1 Tax=Chondrus crispus TaxID=2769 RepID=R7QIV4_CHOCR|nr:unnamed protein product [Chondrus crispus]CDF37693.1 unnamed protein product [Chondrus crispus]|eukprot:XP_005717564.1 unnamed protein product [Chondrus crispus]
MTSEPYVDTFRLSSRITLPHQRNHFHHEECSSPSNRSGTSSSVYFRLRSIGQHARRREPHALSPFPCRYIRSHIRRRGDHFSLQPSPRRGPIRYYRCSG